jgi:hypothetical protein
MGKTLSWPEATRMEYVVTTVTTHVRREQYDRL